MYSIRCKKCDFEASATLPLNMKKCPVCSAIIEEKRIRIFSEEIAKLPKPKPKIYTLNIDGCKLQFGELKDDDVNFCKEFSSKDTQVILADPDMLMEFNEYSEITAPILDNDKYSIAILAAALILENPLPFLYKYDYLLQTFSSEQLNYMSMKYDSELRKKYDKSIMQELSKMQSRNEEKLMLLESIEKQEDIINQALVEQQEKEK